MENDLNNIIICCILPSAVLIFDRLMSKLVLKALLIFDRLMSKLVLKALLILNSALIFGKSIPSTAKYRPPSR